jgi:outer membrane protein TolC
MQPALLLAAALLLVTPAAPAAELGGDADGLLAYAREHNPELAQRRLEAEAAHAAADAAGALPDPSFQLELMDFTNVMSGGSTSLLPGQVGETRLAINQALPFPGKRALRTRLARQQAGQNDAMTAELARDIEMRIRMTHAGYYLAAAQQRILAENRELYLAQERQVVTRYAAGLVPQQDAIRAQSEITALRIEEIAARQRRQEAAASLNALLPRAADAPLAEPQAPRLPAALPSLAVLREQLAANAPELAREEATIGAAQSARELALRERYPDFMLGLRDNRPRTGSQTWDLMLEVNIPLQQSARRSREHEAMRRLEAARAAQAATRAGLEGRLGEIHAAYAGSFERLQLLRGTLLPQAQATLKAAEAGYATGQVNFDTLIEARRQILRTRLEQVAAEAECAQRLADLQRLTGVPL